jgi:hypothetical protein
MPNYGAWEIHNITHVLCPWPLFAEGKPVSNNKIPISIKAAASLTRVLQYVWEQVGQDEEKIKAAHYDQFSGSFVIRPIRRGNSMSTHSYGRAIDWDDQHNQQGAQVGHTLFTAKDLLISSFLAESWIWGGKWNGRTRDAMHVQAALVK